jgi:hypothetical protein
VKRKSLDRIQAELLAKLLPQTDPHILKNEIHELLNNLAGDSARNANLASNLAAYLTQKYWITDTKAGGLRRLIQYHAKELRQFIDDLAFKEFYASLKAGLLPKLNKQTRRKLLTKTELAQRRKLSKKRYDSRRCEYRDGLIEEQFGTFSSPLHSIGRAPEGPCLDVFSKTGAVVMAGRTDSLENLFGVDRHRFPKSLPHERRERNQVYSLDAFVSCLAHLLANGDSNKQWLPDPIKRKLVLTGIIRRAHQFSPKIAVMLVERLLPYFP